MKILGKNSYISKIAQMGFIFVFAFVLVTPVLAEPGNGANNTNNTPAGANNTNNTPAGADNTGLNIKTGIINPLSSELDTIPKFIEKILEVVLTIGIPIVTLAIIYSGFLFVTAQGNSEKLKKAKQTFIYTIIGAALLLGSFVISKAIVGTVDEIKNEDLKNQTK
jgi:hypothetical protein